MKAPKMVVLISRCSAAIAVTAASIGCATVATPPPRTIGLVDLIRNAESYRGQTVRTCAQRLEPGDSVWHLILPQGRHGARLLVVPSGDRPVLDRDGCIVGRIARRDGSIGLGPPGEPGIVADDIADYTWFLHERPRRPE
jgi:hypothetical protein